VVRLKVIVKLSGDLLEISLNRLLPIGGGYALAHAGHDTVKNDLGTDLGGAEAHPLENIRYI
jgi:hypothetical protein